MCVCVHILYAPDCLVSVVCSVHGDIFYSYTSYVRLIGKDLPCFYRTLGNVANWTVKNLAVYVVLQCIS